MTVLPVVLRELRMAAGRRQVPVLRVLAAALALAVLAWLFLVDTTGAVNLDGRRLLRVLASVAFFYCLVAGAVTTANAVSNERREGTLGLLLLTDLGGHSVVFGKLTVAALPLLSAVVGLLPLLAVSLLVGGVNVLDVARIAIVLGNTLFLSLSVGLFVSTVSRHESRALTAAFLTPLALTFGPYLLGQLLYGAEDREPFEGLPAPLLWPSPWFALSLVHDDATPTFRWRDFVLGLLTVHATAWLFLGAAGAWVTRLVRETAHRPWLRRLEQWVQDWVFGSGPARVFRRGQLLDRNPVLWLTSRHRHKGSYVWLFVASMAAVALVSGMQTKGIWFEWKTSLLFLLLVHGAFKLCFVSEACHRLGTDRQRGGFELLLTTPTSVETLAVGHGLGLRRTFRGPTAAVVALDTLWLWLDWHRPEPDHDVWLSAVFLGVIWAVLFVDFAALRWLSLWQTLVAPTAAKAAQACVGRILLLPWALFLGTTIPADWIGWRPMVGRGRDAVVLALLALLWLGVSGLNALWWGGRARGLFLRHARLVAAEGPSAARRLRFEAGRELVLTVVRRWREAFTLPFWRRHPVLASIVIGVMAVLIALGASQVRLQRQIEVRVAALRAAGVPITSAELTVWQPPVPSEQNATVALRLALERLNIAPATRPEPIFLPGRRQTLSLVQRQAYAALLRTNASAIEATEAAIASEKAWFDPELQFSLLPGRFRGSLPLRLSAFLLVDAVLRLEEDQTDDAIRRIRQVLQLAELVGRQPRCVGQNVRHGMIHQALDVTERLLAKRELTAEQLDCLRVDLHRSLGDAALNRALAGEQWLLIDLWQRARYGPPSTGPGGGGNIDRGRRQRDWPTEILLALGRVSGAAGREFLQVVIASESLMQAFTAGGPNRLPTGRAFRDGQSAPGWFFGEGQQWAQTAGGTVVSQALCEARVRAAIVSLALVRHRTTAASEPWPTNLVEFAHAAGLGPEVALDPFSTEALRLRTRERGFAVSSQARHSEDVFWISRFLAREGSDAVAFVVDR